MKNMLLIAAFAMSLNACGENAANIANTLSNTNTEASNGANSASGSNSTVNTNANANANVNKTADSSPKRISFNRGANWGAVNMTLAPGASLKFVVGAKSGQTMNVEASSREVSINLTKGRAATTEDFGFLNAELLANGDYIFEVKNPTKKEVKTSLKVTVENGQTNEIDESGAIVNKDEMPAKSANDK